MTTNWRWILIGEFTWKRALRSILFIYGFLLVVGLFFSERLIFPYNQSSYTEKMPGLALIEASDGTQIATRFWKARREKFLLLYFHGNAEDLGHLDFIAEKLERRGFSVLAIDYRGYGLSAGTATEQSCYDDAQLLYDTAINMGYTSENIIIWGRSVGSGPAVDLALHKDAHALVLDSPFSSAFRVMTKIPIVPFDRFNNLSKIDKIDEPLFIIHGDSDRVISSWHSEHLFRKHAGKKERYLVPNAGHNDLWSHDLSDILDKLDLFVDNQSEQ